MRKARGTYRKDRDNPKAPQLDTIVPAPLAQLDEVAQACWDDLLGPLTKMRVLTEADRAIFQITVESYADYRAARKTVSDEGATYATTTKAGELVIRPHPAVAMMQDAWRRCRLGLIELGLTPSARRHVNASEAPPKSPWEELTGG